MILQASADFVDMLESLHDQGASISFDGQWHQIQSDTIVGKCTQRSFGSGCEVRIWELDVLKDMTLFRKGNQDDTWIMTIILGTAQLENRSGDVKFGKGGSLSTIEFHNLKKDEEFVLSGGGRMTSCAFIFDSTLLEPFLREADEELKAIVAEKQPLAMYELVDRTSRSALQQCIAMDFGDEFGRRLLENCMEFLFLLNLQKFWRRLNGHVHLVPNTDDLSYQRMLKASTLFNDYRNPPSLETLSKFVGLNTMATNELFKQVYGKTPYQFFNDKRLNEAYQLISESDIRIADVGVQLGYGNMSHFSKAFKKQYGILPKQLQMQGA